MQNERVSENTEPRSTAASNAGLSSRKVEQLCRDLSLLSHIGDGLSPELDIQLRQLRRYLSDKEAEQKQIHSYVKEINRVVSELEKTQSYAKQQSNRRLKQLTEPLAKLSNDKKLKNQIKQCAQLIGCLETLDQLPDILQSYHTLLLDFADHIQNRLSKQSNQQTSWWQAIISWLERDTKINLSKRVRKALATLITAFPDVDEHAGSLLLNELKREVSLDALPSVLANISQLLLTTVGTQTQAHAEFLAKLNERLAEMADFLVGLQQDEDEKWQATEALTNNIHEQMQDLADATQQATALDELQEVIAARLDIMGKVLDDYQSQEKSRMQITLKTIGDMQARLRENEEDRLDLEKKLNRERDNARLDPLTGLYNRQAYIEQINHAHKQWQQQQTNYCLVIADVDYFKQLNDTYGHVAGDKILRILANLFKDNLRDTDFIGRYGGEEFVFILNTDCDNAEKIIEKLRQVIDAWKFPYEDKLLHITVSFGIAQFALNDTPDSIFKRADKLLYQAKHNGRNQVCD